MTSTQQNEALQAVRLLRGHALSSYIEPKTQATIETIYQACKLLEGFIESAGVLESTDINYEVSDVIEHRNGYRTWTRGNVSFRLGNHIWVDEIGTSGKITELSKSENGKIRVGVVLDIGKNCTGYCAWTMTGDDVIYRNPNGGWE